MQSQMDTKISTGKFFFSIVLDAWSDFHQN